MSDDTGPAASKRQRVSADVDDSVRLCKSSLSTMTPSDNSASSATIALLTPVRSLIQPFLSDEDAARLMRVSSSFTASLLTDFTFRRRIKPNAPTAAALGRVTALYERYRMRVTRVELVQEYKAKLVDEVTGLSLLPAALVGLRIGHIGNWFERRPNDSGEVYQLSDMVGEDERAKECIENRVELYRRRMLVRHFDNQSQLAGCWNEPLTPGALPPKLQSLQLGSLFNQPLTAGVLPVSLTSLSLSHMFNQPLLPGQLPSSLTSITFDFWFNQPLLPGVLPASLVDLELGRTFNQPLQPGSLPHGLRRLMLGTAYNQPIPPGILPLSLTHLHLPEFYDQPLQAGSLPEGLVQLYFSVYYNQPLTAGVLPSSLRELQFCISCWEEEAEGLRSYDQPILPGQLPDGLECLVLPPNYEHDVEVGVLPEGLLALDLGDLYFWSDVIPDGVLPHGLRWLRISEGRLRWLRDVLPPAAQGCWVMKGGGKW